LSINDVTSFNFLSSCCHACCVTSIIRLSETKACNLFERNKIREELIFLCITATVIIYLNTHRVLQEEVQSKTHITESEFVNHTTWLSYGETRTTMSFAIESIESDLPHSI
jgi:hypothetical protein